MAPTATKKLSPSERQAARRSDKKAKNSCLSADAPTHTPVQCNGVLPGTSPELREAANQAMRAGEHTKAVHLYTMAIDLVTRTMPKKKDGTALDADLVTANSKSEGELAKLLSNRSLVYLKLGDTAAATEDADTCTRTEPSFEKGHLRLLAALEARAAPLQLQVEACERGIAECPGSETLVKQKWQLKKALAAQPSTEDAQPRDADTSAIEKTRNVADDPDDPRRATAAADLGTSLAVGAHGLQKDLGAAEKYLRIGAEAGDVVAMRNLGLVLLDTDRPVEASEMLSRAAEAGDEQAAATLQQLVAEASEQQAQARAKLEAMAAAGDARAAEMLAELSLQ